MGKFEALGRKPVECGYDSEMSGIGANLGFLLEIPGAQTTRGSR